ncbi:hypothetical protein CPB86DRAFT_873331 [Serendipita vermifera]|nr:hypothetical protein CPB86DRAFT_873331 [Serendipita vermifera]
MSLHGRKRKRQDVIDEAILAATVAKNASDMIAVLAPLKATMGMLIAFLESIKDVQTNQDRWESLIANISAKLDMIRSVLKDKPDNTAVHDLVFEYSGELNRILSGLQLIIGTGIDALQTSNNDIIQILASHSHDHAQNHAQILKQQQSMSDRLEDIQSKQKETISQMTEAEKINLIKGVNTASLANGGIHRSCMKGTRLTVLEEARKWMVEDDVPQLFWLNGVAGSGKSTVAKQLSEEWKPQGRLAGRFFFSRDAEETRSPKLFFTTIAQQGLSHLGSAPRTAVAFGIRKLLDPVSATLEEQCSEIFEAPLQVVRLNAVLVLDALDECELRTCQQLLRVLLPRLLNLPRLKIFLTSRPELHIREQLQRSTHHFLAFRIDAPENIQDVELYMRRTVDGLSLPEEQTRQLIARADGLFIWATTVCELLQNIRGSRDAFICRVLNEGIRQMDSIYQIALEQAIRNNEVEESMEAYMNVLKVVVVAYEPLSPDAINQLLDISNGMEIVGDLRSVFECHGVDEPVRFLHPTFREFLLDSDISGQFYVDISSAHHLMATSCFFLMNKDLKYDLFNLFDNYGEKHPQGEFEELCLEKTSLGLKYSCIFWGSHVCATTITNSPRTTVISTIESFFTTNLIHWLYLIALVGTFNGATSMLRRLLSTDLNENITRWSMDTMRFLHAHWNIIRNNPFHVYHYIAFTPFSSIFQQIYARSLSFPQSIACIGPEADWPPEAVIQSPHKIDVQTLSRCGSWLATGGCSNNRPAFAIWDVQTADSTTVIHPCDSSGCSINYLTFYQSANNVKLRTRCKCERLCIWDIASDPPVLLQEIQLESSGTCKWWSDDGDKAISERIDQLTDFTLMIFSLNILSDTGQISSLDLGVPYGPCRWKFSPGSGERVVQWSELTIIVWECSSRHQCFKKSVFPHQYGNFDQILRVGGWLAYYPQKMVLNSGTNRRSKFIV